MRIKSVVFMVMAALLVFGGDALAKGPASGGGGGGGGGDTGVPPDYGDLVKLYRDDFGVPILTDAQCQQPLGFISETCLEDLLENAYVTCINLDEDSDTCEFNLLPVDEETCAILPGYEGCTEEPDFGRMNSARAPDSVLESQLNDVLVNLATADCVSLDPAGRLVTSRVEKVIIEDEEGTQSEVDVVTSGAIDSPLQNLAIYKQLMLEGLDGELGSYLPEGASLFDTAARALGAASGKSGEVNVDLVAYLNQIMGLTVPDTSTSLDKICIDPREEVMGSVVAAQKCFLNYGGRGFPGPNASGYYPSATVPYPGRHDYARLDNFSVLPNPGNISPREYGDVVMGWFEYLAPLNVDNRYSATFKIGRDRILNRVFGSDLGFAGGNIGGFAQAADDARAVINYMHSWPLPAEYATPSMNTDNCSASTDARYDLSISPESGLQVPVQMVATTDTTEGREFIVNIANAGPDPATGKVLVTVETAEGDDTAVVEIDSSYWNGDDNRFEFPFTDIAKGTGASWTVMFTMSELIATKLTWTATIVAEDDVLSSNNTVVATTNVRLTGKGGGRP